MRPLRPALLVLLLLVLGGLPALGPCPIPEADLAPPPWPKWVLGHWVWENSGTQESALRLVDDYLARDVPVDALIVDRPWEPDVTSFTPDPDLYPDMQQLVDDVHARGVRFLLWGVSVVNEGLPEYQEGVANGYFLNDGALVPWWAGRGAFLDYKNPEAVEWWHGMMDGVLDLGIDGWKVDGTDPFVLLTGAVGPGLRYEDWPEYAADFYRDFFRYTRERLGPDRVIMARPADTADFFLEPFPFAPRDVGFAGWVGDQDGTFEGLRAALENMKKGSELGHVNFGSDIGGFRGSGLRDRELFVRWAQLGALCAIMENGGGGEHRPWLYDGEVLDLYRRAVRLHLELGPYLYGAGAASWNAGVSLMRFLPEGEYHYTLGEDLLVAPVVRAGGRVEVHFPPGRWIHWLDETGVFEGPAVATLDFPLADYPVFVREGAIVPLAVETDATGHGGAFAAGHLTVAVFPAPPRTGRDVARFDLPEEGRRGGVRFTSGRWGDALSLSASPSDRPLLWRIRAVSEAAALGPGAIREEFGPAPVEVGSVAELASAPRTWTRGPDGALWIRVADPQAGVRLRISP